MAQTSQRADEADGRASLRRRLGQRLGRTLLLGGLSLGVATGVVIMLPSHLSGFAWLLGVGLAKLAFVGAAGLMGAGAVVLRLDARERRALPAVRTPPP